MGLSGESTEAILLSNGLSLHQSAAKCSLGCPWLDAFLGGGLPIGSVTELVGECGSAKTQLCLQLLIASQIPRSHGGLQSSSLYLFTESYFPYRRLCQLSRSFLAGGRFDHYIHPGSCCRSESEEASYGRSELSEASHIANDFRPLPNKGDGDGDLHKESKQVKCESGDRFPPKKLKQSEGSDSHYRFLNPSPTMEVLINQPEKLNKSHHPAFEKILHFEEGHARTRTEDDGNINNDGSCLTFLPARNSHHPDPELSRRDFSCGSQCSTSGSHTHLHLKDCQKSPDCCCHQNFERNIDCYQDVASDPVSRGTCLQSNGSCYSDEGFSARIARKDREQEDLNSINKKTKKKKVDFNPCDNVFVQAIETAEELLVFLDQAHLLLSQPLEMPVRLIVIDSMAALFRSDFDNTLKDLTKRADWFFAISAKLKRYAQKYGLAVVLTNQVVDYVGPESESKPTLNPFPWNDVHSGNVPPLFSSGRRVVPALGLSWSHCVNTRLFLSRSLHLVKTEARPNGYSTPRSSVLEQLETELPDSILLGLPDNRIDVVNKNRITCDGASCASESEPPDLKHEEEEVSGHPSLLCTSLDSPGSPMVELELRRSMQVVFAPHLPNISCDFVVERDIIRCVPCDKY